MRGWKTVRFLYAVFIGGVAAITVWALLHLGMVVPGLVIDSGVDTFKGDERKIADDFHSYEMWRNFSEGPEAYMVTGARVTEVERCPGAPLYNPRSNFSAGAAISGTIQVHTIFGIPYRKIERTCGPVAAG